VKQTVGAKRGRRGIRVVVAVVIMALAYAGWRSLSVGPAPVITITTDRPAIGPATKVTAAFAEERGGLGLVRLELVQGDRAVVLAEQRFSRPSVFALGIGETTPEATLETTVGSKTQAWLQEGAAVLRATADRMAGPLRGPVPVVAETRLPVRLHPPRLEVLSSQHYVEQGGAGVVVFRVGSGTARSGVRAGSVESLSYPLPGGPSGERFTLYAIPWTLETADIRAFAEDDAGNRVEIPFVNGFKPVPPSTDTITLGDDFLARVVPAIASQTPGVPANQSLLHQYLYINGEVRKEDLARVHELTRDTAQRFMWSGAFLQMPNTARRANFAEMRTYLYGGRVVDHQTHLGLDLASTANAVVPAANAGRVIFAGWLDIYGNAVIIDHGYGLASLYGHLSSIEVKAGDTVEKGQTIARSGSTGLAGGDHLHLEIFIQGQSVSPLEWLDAHWIAGNVTAKLDTASGQ
jgi:murein DD-endopeptidase MepM/ murein hydrolase activator NlpD